MAAALAFAASGGVAARGPKGARDADLLMAVNNAYKRYKSDKSGKIASDVPVLATVSPDLYGIVIVRVDGKVFEAGNSDNPFVLATAAMPFTAALLAGQPESAAKLPADVFNLDGSLTTIGLIQPQGDANGKWQALLGNLGAFAGHELYLDQRVYQSATAAAAPVQEAARRLAARGTMKDDAASLADLYVKQATVGVSARDLAMMAATLANGGKHPSNGRVVISPESSQNVQAAITNSGLKLLGMPAVASKTGAIVVVVPGRWGMATYSPPLDSAGVSVRGQRALRYLGKALMITPDPNP